METVTAYLGLGSNLGDRGARLREAVDRLRARPDIHEVTTSALHESAPVGGPPQGWFVNAVARVVTTLSPRELLEACLAVERTMGRVRTVANGPRVIDVDVLLYGEEVVEEPGLVIPHPQMTRRRFVLVPLAELAAELVHPVARASIATLLERLAPSQEIVRRYDG